MRQFRILGALVLIVLTLLAASPAVLADAAAISVVAYLDENGNGKLDEGEPTVAGGEVTLTDASGNIVATETLSDAGATIQNLGPGQYTVSFVPGEGYALAGLGEALTFLPDEGTVEVSFGLTAVEVETAAVEPTATPQPVATATPVKIATSEPTATTARATAAPTAAPTTQTQGGFARVSGILVALVALMLPLGVRMLRRP